MSLVSRITDVVNAIGADVKAIYAALAGKVSKTGDTITGQLSVAGNSNAVQLIVKTYSSQSAYAQEWQNSSNVRLSGVMANGTINAPQGSKDYPAICFNNDSNSGFYTVADGTVSFSSNGVTKWLAAGNTGLSAPFPTQAMRFRNDMGIGWSSDPDNVADEFLLFRSAANTLRLTGSLIVDNVLTVNGQSISQSGSTDQNLTLTSNRTIAAGFGSYVPGFYELAAGAGLEIGAGGVFEIG